jgi:hypothetical protein
MAEVVKLVNEDMEDPDTEMYKVDNLNDEISDLTIEIMDKENYFLTFKDLDNYCEKLLGKNYFSDKRCWSYLHDAIYDIYWEMREMNDDFDESMQTGLGMAQQLPTNSVYDGELDDLYNFDDEEEKKKMNKRLEEKKINSEDKKQALADYLEVDVEEIEDGYDENHFEVNGEEYMVLSEDESYDEFKDWEMSLIDDMGLDAFSENFQEHILENCINDSWFEQVAEEEADFYIGDMSDEDLLEYAHDHKIAKKIDDVDDEDFDRSDIEDECKEIYEEEILEQGISEYFENIYGRGWAKEMKDTLQNEIDWEKVIEDMYDWDGRDTVWGSMAGYDGEVRELDKVNGEYLFAYRTN